MAKPIVAIVGRPNVGKSTIFNKLTGQRLAIVEDTPGVTRDRIFCDCEWSGHKFLLVDTGGIEPRIDDGLLAHMREQAQLAIDSADCIVMVTELSAGVTPQDQDVASMLMRSGKPVVLAVNKCDKVGEPPMELYDFYSLGLGELIPVSGVHGHGTGDLLDAVCAHLNFEEEPEDADDRITVAVIGRPNVGKSSLINHILGENRLIVANEAGTTRDAIDTMVENKYGKFVFTDTAGLRKKGKVESGVERYSVLRSLAAVERSRVCVIMIDATVGFTEQDSKVAGYAHEQGKACIIVVNKWDAVEKDSYTMDTMRKKLEEDFSFMSYAPIVFISAKTGQRVDKLFSLIHEVYEQTKKEYAEIAETSAKLIGERMEALCGTKDESVTVWNTLGHRRNDVVVLGETAAEAMTDGTTVYPVQQTKDGAIVYAENLPSKGYQVLRPTSGAAAETPFWRYPVQKVVLHLSKK